MTGLFILACGLLALVVHECGHLLAAAVFGIKTKSLRIDPRGIGIVRERGPWFDSMVVALSGPLLNLAFAAAFRDETFRIANLCLGLVNLIPVYGSDGSHILECLAKVECARHDRTLRSGLVDEVRVHDILARMETTQEHFYVSVRTYQDAERLYERIFYAGADTSRITICTEARAA
jgi:hypothetical protein